VLTPIGNKTGNEGTLITFTATATDSDLPAQSLAYTLDAGAPSGASMTAGGVFTWTPTELQGPSVFTITVRVTDNGSPALNDFETIAITVNEVNVSPVLAAISAQNLAFSLDAGAPAGASINPANGVFTWTPAVGHSPVTNSVTVRVTDNGSPPLSASRTFNAIVVGAPLITSVSNNAGIITVRWTSVPTRNYRVEFKNDLSAASWTPLGSDVTAIGSSSSITDNIGGNPQRFYRVQLVN